MWSRACPAIFREKGSPPGDAGQQASPANGVDGAGLARLSRVVVNLIPDFQDAPKVSIHGLTPYTVRADFL